MAKASLNLFGTPTLRRMDGLDVTPRSKKTLCMVAFLALQPGGQATRERLSGLLWSDRDEEHARGALRQAVVELRQFWSKSGDDFLIAGRDTLGLDLTRFTVDALEAERLLATASPEDIPRIAMLWKGEFLDGITSPDRAFDEWLAIERAHRSQTLGRTLTAGLDRAEQHGLDDEAMLLAEVLLRHDPTHERACRAVIEIRTRRGDAAAALRCFASFRDALARELDIKPSAELENLVARIRRSAKFPAARTEQRSSIPHPIRRMPRLAVMFRAPVGPLPIAAELQAALEEELLLGLGHARTLAVLPMADAAQEIGSADHTLYVMLRHDGRTGQIIFRLMYRPEGQQVIVERVMLPESDFYAVLAVEVARVAFAVEHAINVFRAQPGLDEQDAYALWLEGDRLSESFEPDALMRAVPLFQRAAEADTHFAPPLAGLASIELSLPMAYPSDEPPADRIERGLTLAKRAVAINPWDARSRVIMAWAYLRKRLPDLARAEFERALALNSSDPDVLIAAAEGFSHLGDAATGLGYGERALRMHPSPPDYYHHYLSIAYIMAGAHERALAHGLSIPVVLPEQFAWRALAFSRLRQEPEAHAEVQRLLRHAEQRWAGKKPFHPREAAIWLERTLLTADHDERQNIIKALAPWSQLLVGDTCQRSSYRRGLEEARSRPGPTLGRSGEPAATNRDRSE